VPATAEIQVYPGMGHDVAGREIDDLVAFVVDQLAVERSR